jgi:MoaA/NifB/PqqE/SkfB family radical SAM enzyme
MTCTHIMCLATTRCSLLCSHCLRDRPGEQHDLPLPLWRRILNESKRLGFYTVGFTGGEPALHPQFEQLVEAAVDKGFYISVATNGIQPAPYLKAFDQYGRNVFTYAKISLDGLEAENDRIRGQGAFAKTVRSIKEFQRVGLDLAVAFCMTRANLHCLRDFLTFCHDLGVRSVDIASLISTEGNRDLVPTFADMDRAREVITEMETKFHTRYSTNCLVERRPYPGYIVFCNELSSPTLTINAQGEAFLCCSATGPNAVVGSLEQISVAEAYRRALGLGTRILEQRIRDLADENLSLGFNSCDYCNKVLATLSARPEDVAQPTRSGSDRAAVGPQIGLIEAEEAEGFVLDPSWVGEANRLGLSVDANLLMDLRPAWTTGETFATLVKRVSGSSKRAARTPRACAQIKKAASAHRQKLGLSEAADGALVVLALSKARPARSVAAAPVVEPSPPAASCDCPPQAGTMMIADIKLGYYCNNNCVHCVVADQRDGVLARRHNTDRGTEEYKQELIQSRQRGVTHVVFTGGEPTMRSDLVELATFARSLGLSIWMQSNGRRFRQRDYAEQLKGLDILYCIAVHSHRADKHDAITRSNGSFVQTVEGIKNLVALGENVSVKTVLSKRNYPDLEAIVAWLAELGIRSVSLVFPHAQGNARKLFDEVVPRYTEIARHVHAALRYCRRQNIGASAEAIPFCFMKGFEDAVSELVLLDVPTELSQLDFQTLDWAEVRKNCKSKFPQCSRCRYDAVCEGPWDDYAAHYGGAEFVPVEDAPDAWKIPSRRTVATLSEQTPA